jgi:1-aminocyclopropane-1-carboxylate deaminase/D-cysteine desulfhydrase-like pyridoxal-dependent ACC family enzyme
MFVVDAAPARAPLRSMTRALPTAAISTSSPLAELPTPLESYADGLWIKRDDLTHARYGGNKVRKLHYLLADAARGGYRRLLTVGALGSHHVLATTLFGRARGFEVAAVLVPQPGHPHVAANLSAALAAGLQPIFARNYVEVPWRFWRATDAETYRVAAGGSSPLGSLGYVDAAQECAAQWPAAHAKAARHVAKHDINQHDLRVVVALGSGGTVAGLAVGFAAQEFACRVHAVAISKPVVVLGWMMKRLIAQTALLHCEGNVARGADLARRAWQRVCVVGQEVGQGYGAPTVAGARATEYARQLGIQLDPTYTAKSFAHALTLVRDGRGPVLFWHTLSRVRPPGLEAPNELQRRWLVRAGAPQ